MGGVVLPLDVQVWTSDQKEQPKERYRREARERRQPFTDVHNLSPAGEDDTVPS